MRKAARWGVLALAVTAGLVGLGGHAADHRDGTIFPNTAVNGRRDINDMYIFVSPANPANTVLVFTVSPFAGAQGGTPTTFDQSLFFDMKIDTNGDAVEDLTFRITFGAPDANGVQPVTLRGLPAASFPPTGILARGFTGQNIPVRGGGMFRAAYHDDPFFFDSFGTNQLTSGNPPPGFVYPRPIGTARNFFGPNVNLLAMILELPSSTFGGNGANIGYWGRTEVNGVQVDRMGRPGINTVLIPPVPRNNLTRGERRNAFNAGIPSNDRRDFKADMVSVLMGFFGRNATDADGLSNFLLPDILTFQVGNASGFPNGRRLRDDVIDIELGLLTNGAITTDNVPDDNGTRITDGNMGTVAAFPYVGPPNNPPQGLIFQ